MRLLMTDKFCNFKKHYLLSFLAHAQQVFVHRWQDLWLILALSVQVTKELVN